MVQQRFSSAWLRNEDGYRTEVAGICTIGRSSTNHLVLPHRKVSRRHAIVHVQGDNEYWLVDLGSSNGTYLNNHRITNPTRLRDQDRIDIGQFLLTFCQASTGDEHLTNEKNLRSTAKNIEETPAWLMVADIRGSTSLNQRQPPDQVATRITDWFGECKKFIEEQGGDLDKYLGDGFLAYWIDVNQPEFNVGSALEALREFQDISELPFRVAIHHGIVHSGYLPTMGRARLFGTEVNFAFRMEQLAKQLDKSRLMSQSALQRLEPFLPVMPLGYHELPGFDGSFRFYEF